MHFYRTIRSLPLLVFTGVISAQSSLPVPMWSGIGSPPVSGEHYVFMSPDRSKVFVVLPGTNEPVTIQLHNQLVPSAAVVISTHAGQLSYVYSVRNADSAGDYIGEWSLSLPLSDSGIVVSYKDTRTPGAWSGAPSAAEIAKQTQLPGAPNGRYVGWFKQEGARPISPGTTQGGFELLSCFRPGFTTAYVSQDLVVGLPDTWPNVVNDQLVFLSDLSWKTASLLTVGPVFPDSSNQSAVKLNLDLAIKQLVRLGKLSPTSPFVQEVATLLGSAIQPESILSAVPSSEEERQIKLVVEMSLLGRNNSSIQKREQGDI